MKEEMSAENKKFDLLNNRLSETEKSNLFLFCKNEGMVHAVEKALLYGIYEMGTVKKDDESLITINWAMGLANSELSNEEKGKKLDIVANSVATLQDAFRQIKKFGVETLKIKEPENNAV